MCGEGPVLSKMPRVEGEGGGEPRQRLVKRRPGFSEWGEEGREKRRSEASKGAASQHEAKGKRKGGKWTYFRIRSGEMGRSPP